ncbi:PD-(D/E)XK nuclease family protein [Halostagnicola sp. A-GB9-2]|uniref:PD-(D/E)XK nuclease family protein n=1 Tax=Halostagnicola sp. A-GB9-2 TaxID=3048066 RepID=UPI0024C04B6F|nr:PD-(D/E)XK nuclease family protein [Halostagnicola sp. A-GB9-2]MDJ1432286.1 PD-(D/E)XK nuclease family protein [Halostagnicola sp. A-GB9-2]
MSDRRLSVGAIESYLRCPRRYEFAHVQELHSDEADSPSTDRVDLLRRAICDGLRTGETDPDSLESAVIERLSTLWSEYDERFHSRAQREFERRVLDATARAYVDAVGAAHASGLAKLRNTGRAGELVGPDLPLSSTVSVSTSSSAPSDADDSLRSVALESAVDYVYGEGSSLVGVRFVPTIDSLGLLRYRSSWEGDVETLFADHFDPDDSTFEPGPVGALLETAVVLDGLRELCDRLGLEGRTCRYLLIPLADRSQNSVNWVSETVETTVEGIDLTDIFIDHHTFGMTHEHRNGTIENRLATVVEQLVSGSFDPSRQWDQIESESCPDCGYAVCCPEYLSQEVRFDG